MGSTAGWRRGGWRRRTALAALALVVAGSHRAGATLPDGAAGEGEAAEPPSGPAAPPLAVAVRSAWPAVQPEAVRKAVEEELRSWVVLVAPETVLPAYARRLLVDVTPARGVLAVQYDAPGRKPLVRVIPIFGTGEAAVRTIAWLAGNLVRDQASDLLPAPAAPPRAEAGAQPSPATAAPAPLPAPDTAMAVPSLTFQAGPPARGDYALATASLFFPLATNGYEPGIRTHLSANLLYGRVGALDGGQLGTANEVTGNVRGFQLGLLFNRAGGDVEGAQVAAVNSARGQVTGTQAGLVNAAGDVQGAQIGLVNVGRNVHGLQLGLVNVSEDIDGVPIGIINVSRTGGIHATIWTSGTMQLAVGLKFSTRNVYTLFSGATQSLNGSRLYGPGLAVGYRIPLRPIVLETDVGGTYLLGGPLTGVSRTDGLKDDMALASWRVLAAFEFHRHLSLFGGAALTTRFRFYQTVGQDLSYELGPDLFAGVQL
jgi:hypothetical protein